ncbi:hypothetical protein KFL_002150250 [Klebsormidium nitens]|uniref:PAS domain-containing protein n=1 Tax=Klebsormidium nitens TaxID=105231 RepID=A0A1Y1I236_KLENI|nr:hypothetical protein KFL_002150250 [Klebsormidium nitens]|eukprot:GAQ84990.1 hypothetical protein KFL_002150250 [Klebsormidium nitens]
MAGQLRVGVPFVQLMHRYRAIAPRPLHGEPVKTEDSSKTPQGSGSTCSGRTTPHFEGQDTTGKQGVKRGCNFEQPAAKRMKRGDAQVASMRTFELPTPIALPRTQPGRFAAGPVETKNSRYMLNFQPPLPFCPTAPGPAQAPFPPPTYPTSSLSRYQSSTTGPPLPLQHFPPYSQVNGGTVLGVPVSRSLSEQVVPTNHFPPRQQHSSPCPSEGAVTTGGFSTPPLLVVAPQNGSAKAKGEKEKEKGSGKPRGLVPIAPKSEPLRPALPSSGGVQASFRSSGGFRVFGAKGFPLKRTPISYPRAPLVPPIQGKVIRAWPVKQEPVSVASPFARGRGFAESKSLGSGGSGFRQFTRPETKRGEPSSGEKTVEFPAHGGSSHSPAILDSLYLEQLYGAFVEPVMVTDPEHKLLWSNRAFQRAADENQGGCLGKTSKDALPSEGVPRTGPDSDTAAKNHEAALSNESGAGCKSASEDDTSGQSGSFLRNGSALDTASVPGSDQRLKNEPMSKSGVTADSAGNGAREAESEIPQTPANKSAIPVPISSIQYQGPSETPPCAAILWVFLKQPGFLAASAPPSSKPNPSTPVADASSLLGGASDVVSKGDDSSSGSSSSTNSFATATSQERRKSARGKSPGGSAPGVNEPPLRVVTPRPLRPAGSTIRFEDIEPLASNASLAVKGSFELIKRQFDRWSSPVILTDLKNRARWVNAAYKKLVGQPPCAWSVDGSNLEQLRLTGGISIAGLEALKTLPASLKCTATVNWPEGGEGRPLESCCMGTRIDSVGSEVLGYLWRFGTPLSGQTASGAGENVARGNASD